MSTPEGRIKRKIDRYLASLGDDCWSYKPVPHLYGSRTVDYHGCYRGRFFVIEAKRPGKEPTPPQKREMQRVALAGGAAFAIDGDYDLEQFKEWIEWIRNET